MQEKKPTRGSTHAIFGIFSASETYILGGCVSTSGGPTPNDVKIQSYLLGSSSASTVNIHMILPKRHEAARDQQRNTPRLDNTLGRVHNFDKTGVNSGTHDSHLLGMVWKFRCWVSVAFEVKPI